MEKRLLECYFPIRKTSLSATSQLAKRACLLLPQLARRAFSQKPTQKRTPSNASLLLPNSENELVCYFPTPKTSLSATSKLMLWGSGIRNAGCLTIGWGIGVLESRIYHDLAIHRTHDPSPFRTQLVECRCNGAASELMILGRGGRSSRADP